MSALGVFKEHWNCKFLNLFLLDAQNMNENNTNAISDFELFHPEQATAVQDAVVQVTDYLAQFRADNIVWDAEYMKDALLLPPSLDATDNDDDKKQQDQQPKPWGCSLGQSFGGFCSMTYLSLVQHPPRIMLLTGGIAPMLAPDITDVYAGLWERVRQRNLIYYNMYPADIYAVHQIVQKLLDEENPIKLPSGGTLTARRFLQTGMVLGGSPSNFAALHNMITNAFVQLPGSSSVSVSPVRDLQFRRSFLKEMDWVSRFDDDPFYFWMHETIYADGGDDPVRSVPTKWAAQRAYEQKCQESNGFDYEVTSAAASSTQPTQFFGEMVFPWMSEDYAELSGVGLKAVAEALSMKTDWPALYNADHMGEVLASGRTQAAAAVYYDDMFVDFNEYMKVTVPGGPLIKCKVYVTNIYQHSGLRDDGANIFAKLYGMAVGSIRTPS
jgi:hypothetical protein